MSKPRHYLFDVKLFASFRVEAESETLARYWLDEHLAGVEANFGNWVEGPACGQPITAEVAMDGAADLVEVDGVAA